MVIKRSCDVPWTWNHCERIPNYAHAGIHGIPKRCGKLKETNKFDGLFFKVSPKEANAMDPQQRMNHEVVYEALVDAGKQPANQILTFEPTPNHILSSFSLTYCWRAVLSVQVSTLLKQEVPALPSSRVRVDPRLWLAGACNLPPRLSATSWLAVWPACCPIVFPTSLTFMVRKRNVGETEARWWERGFGGWIGEGRKMVKGGGG